MTVIIENGLVTGAIYGLVAVGISLVYKKSGVLNFANGDAGMLGAFVFFALFREQHWPYLGAAAVGVATAAAIGAATYLVLAKRRDDQLAMLIGTLAVSGILIWVGLEVWSPSPHFVPPPLQGVHVSLLGFSYTGARLLVLLAAVALAAGSFALFRYTEAGLLFRASADDAYAAQLMGVDVTLIDVVTWSVAAGLAGLAAILVAPLVGFHVFFMSLLSIRAFAAALVAGMGNVSGSIIAGVALGIAEAALVHETARPGLPEALLVVLVVGVLVFRPLQIERRTA